MNIKQKILSILKERTSTSIYDSGGAYGRHWQRNRKRCLSEEPELTLKFSEIKGRLLTEVNVPLYHGMMKSLVYDHSVRCLQRKIDKILRKHDDDDSDDSYWEFLGKSIKKAGGHLDPFVGTYGSDGWLYDQCINYAFGRLGKRSFLMISVHNGCDIRSGWTDAHVFLGDVPSGSILARGGPRTAAKGRFRLDGTMIETQLFYEWISDDGGLSWKPQWHIPMCSQDARLAFSLEHMVCTEDSDEFASYRSGEAILIEKSWIPDESDSMLCPMTGKPMQFRII